MSLVTAPVGTREDQVPDPAPGAAVIRRRAGRLVQGLPAPVALVLAAAVLTVATWPTASYSASPGLDPSWSAQLSLAYQRHIQFGTDFVFTYGPLGFLTQPYLFFRGAFTLHVLFEFATTACLFAWVIVFLRRQVGLLLSVAIAYALGGVLATTSQLPGCLAVLAFGLVVLDAEQRGGGRIGKLVPPALGGMAAGALLISFGVGLCVAAMSVVAAATFAPRVKRLAVTGSAFVAVLLACWTATHNDLGNLAAYLRGSASITSGYAGGMGLENASATQYIWAAVVALGLIVCYLRSARRHELSNAQAWVVGVSALLVLWYSAKEAFIRHDAEHGWIFFGVALTFVVAAYGLRFVPTHWAGLFAVLALLGMLSNGITDGAVLAPLRSADSLVTDAHVAASAGFAHRETAAGVEALRKDFGVSPEALRAIGRSTVAVYPWDQSVAYAYQSLHWTPLPVIQAYAAYTAYLDQRNAAFFTGRSAPRRILMQPPSSIDAHYPQFESPAAVEAITCNYRPIYVDSRWEVLAKVVDRCGAPRLLATDALRKAVPVPVPAAGPGSMVVMTVPDLNSGWWYQVSSLLLKPGTVTTTSGHRFVPGTAADPHVMLVPGCLGLPPEYSPARLRSFGLVEPGPLIPQRLGTVRFYAVAVC